MTRILIKRKRGEPFLCPKYLQPMTHDEAYRHWVEKCQEAKRG